MKQRYLEYVYARKPVMTPSQYKTHCDRYKRHLKSRLPIILRAIPTRDLNTLVTEFAVQNIEELVQLQSNFEVHLNILKMCGILTASTIK